MSGITDYIPNLLYVFTPLFFAFITKKLFLGEKWKVKAFLSVLLSPTIANFITYAVYLKFFRDFSIYDRDSIISFSLFFTTVQVVLYIICAYLYIKVVRPKNRSIAIFTYVCSIMLVPSFLLMAVSTYRMAVFGIYLALSVAFYFMTVKPLTEIAGEERRTDIRIFLVLPILVFLFSMIMLVLYMYYDGLSDSSLFAITKMASTLSTLSPVYRYFETIALNEAQYLSAVIITIFIANTFILAILIIAFSLITKNIKYMNDAINANKRIKTLSVEVMESLAHTIDAKDKYTRGHSVRVAKYSRMIAEKMGLSEQDQENVYYSGLLHDIGKIGVPDEIINGEGDLSNAEYSVVMMHPSVGADILSEIKSLPDMSIGARYHHERYDGTGYPEGIAGEKIPLLARIIAVADSYDAMTSNRSYRSYLPQKEAREEIERNKGTQFDPVIADIMLQIIDEDKDYRFHE
ncbi:MAG: HD domain-containing protein [Lachnospiraceae bacterium]|nr:HD domain-containing protein [Lachnospiraceae bacterium]